ncbi:tripartite tricarboxylate transporter substrate binding protein [Ramlibacter sp. G-1-2-2]|uniref:Tripartite tricarboxylate transporter substrate binding protein n=1 Tax=Ramlibacter agri TaxID=2728837 RepID=A0A848H6R7_9BURK|nr:tripartite tricarboxylate transporter substrate binding protein [Ramlibacter agri]NML46234.1 tripartite tricarboxylate transporter substrate binding protein [Ramlibacter agri]
MRDTISRRQALTAIAAAAATPLAAQAQGAWPEHPVSIVVGYSAGGAVDAVARTLGQALQKQMGQTFLVDNKPGAGTNIAVKYVINAKPDGYTLLMAANALAANMSLFQPQPFDAEKDLVPVALIGRVPVVLAANPGAPFSNVKQLIEAAKKKPNSVAFASPGNGSTPHMAAELFARAAGIDLMHVPYKGGAQAITDVVGGQVPLLAMNALEVKPMAESGKLKVLAVLSPQRSPIFPDVPTIAESGFKGFEASVWYALMAPAHTPAAIVDKLHAEVQKALASPEVKERVTAVGGEVIPGTRQQLAQLLHSEIQRYAKLVKDANIKAD